MNLFFTLTIFTLTRLSKNEEIHYNEEYLIAEEQEAKENEFIPFSHSLNDDIETLILNKPTEFLKSDEMEEYFKACGLEFEFCTDNAQTSHYDCLEHNTDISHCMCLLGKKIESKCSPCCPEKYAIKFKSIREILCDPEFFRDEPIPSSPSSNVS